jgi:putative copper export protein/mono/diheme cytochrome c family protein
MDWLEIATSLARGLHVAALLSLFGCLVFRRFVAPGHATAGLPLAAVTRMGLVSAWLALAFGGGWLGAVSGAIAGAHSLAGLLDAVPVVAGHTSFGRLFCARLLLLAGIAVLLLFEDRRARDAALLAAGAALALQPLLGHIGALPDSVRTVLIPIEIAHLLAAGAWFGGLSPLLLCVARAPPPLAATLCEQFTPVGLVAVGTLAVTALPQAGELIGGLPALLGTQYGHLALLKLGLFFLALGLACVNRLVLTARLGTGVARRALIGSIAVEAVAVFCVVAAAATMASAPPAIHAQPVWPFPWRPSGVAWEEPELRAELIRLLIAAAAGLLLIGSSLALRRFRILAVALAAIVAAPFARSLELLLVEAYPTSYARSTTGFSVAAIARGQALFGQQCAVCHDPLIGSGGAGDLTAPHIWGHRDGELFWWVSNGVTDPAGNGLMPGFGLLFSEDDIWALVDFIHARNVGARAWATGRWSPPVLAPVTPLNCDGEEAASLADLGHDVLLVADPGPAAAAVASQIGAGSVPGAETIRLARDAAAAPEEGACVTAAAAAWEAWRVLSGVAADRFGGYLAVVDRQGWVRAWLPPGAGLAPVLAAVRDANEHPIAVEARPVGGHHH